MPNKKLYLLGIDGLSYHYIKKHQEQLPNLSRMIHKGVGNVLKSIFPPDSIPSWITIYTGKSPAEHGILDSIDYMNDGDETQIPDVSSYKGKTFWDELSRRGKKVCIINPFMAFPVWDVNGFFINGSVFAKHKKISSNNTQLENKYHVPPLGGLTAFPKQRELDSFIRESYSSTRELSEYAAKIHAHSKYNLFFVTYLTMDRFQHFLWRYSDTNDITYPINNKYQTAILDFYKLFDNIIGEIISRLGRDESLMIISDHGHTQRCTKVVNINEMLRKEGYYIPSINHPKIISKSYWVEKLKNSLLKTTYNYCLEDYLYSLAKLIPNRKSIKKGLHIRSNKSIAEAWTTLGTVPFGGIIINKQNIPNNLKYDHIRKELIRILKNYTHNRKRIFKWVKRREDLLKGTKLCKFPDILFEMDPEYGVSWAIFDDEISINTTHRKISGGHDSDGCLFTHNLKGKTICNVKSVESIYQFITNYVV